MAPHRPRARLLVALIAGLPACTAAGGGTEEGTATTSDPPSGTDTGGPTSGAPVTSGGSAVEEGSSEVESSGGDATTSDDTGADTDTGGEVAAIPPCAAPGWEAADFAAVYEVGPGRAYATPSEVPWEGLGPGTLVKIHRREEPYRDKWVINAAGTAEAPIVVLGVPAAGELPVIDGDGAVTRAELDFWNEDRAVIKIGASSVPDSVHAAHIAIACLDVRGARPGRFFSDDEGVVQEYRVNAAAIGIEEGEAITIQRCALSDSGNGLVSSWQSSEVRLRGNYIYGNGNPGSLYEHNTYTESAGIVFEFNYYGPLCADCPGNNLKDRSAGTVVRYNWIEQGSRQLDLVESDHAELREDARYRDTFVLGNVLIEGDGAGNNQILQYGGDLGDTALYRKGTLHLYHNTIVSTRAGTTTLARLSSDGETVEARNNVVHVTAPGDQLAITAGVGVARLAGNWLPTGWSATHEVLEGSVIDDGNVEGSAPGFVDLDALDLQLAGGSACLDAAGPLDAQAQAPAWQYVRHQDGEVRDDVGDIGAFAG